MKSKMNMIIAGAGVLVGVVTGCSPTIPTYQWTGTGAAVAVLSERSGSIHSLRATGTLVLTSADNQHVTLDAAIVARSGGEHKDQAWLRLRTWKFGQAIFDLTAKPDGVWLAADSNSGPSAQTKPDANNRLASLKPTNIAQAWNLFFGEFPSTARPDASRDTARTFTLVSQDGDATISCDIDKATLTARRYRITDEKGSLRQTLTLARYKMIGDAAWPMLIIAQGDQGRIEVLFDDVEVNPVLEDSVFTPPSRAVKQP